MITYDVVLIDEDTNCSVHYLADSFSVSDGRILHIKSFDCGNCSVKIKDSEVLSVFQNINTDSIIFY